MAEPLTVITERGRNGRGEVLAAAAEAFLERGYAATSIDDIADRLQSTKGRVYHYFRTKAEVFLAIYQLSMERSFAAVRPALESTGSPSDRLARMVAAHALMIMEDNAFMRLGVQYAEMNLVSEDGSRRREVEELYRMRRDYEDMFVTVITEGIRAGEFRPADPRLAAKAVLGSLNWMSVWYRPESGRDQRRTAAALAEYSVGGIRAR